MQSTYSTRLSKPKSIAEMPADARVWVYQSNRELTSEEKNKILLLANQFIGSWNAHGADLDAAFDILLDRFLILSVDEQQASASGCSIDKSVQFMKQLDQQFNLNLFDRMQAAYLVDGKVNVCNIHNLKNELLQHPSVGVTKINETIVFNNMITKKNEFDVQWQLPLKSSWHARFVND
ncbi:MAG: ABC transporter ATPase [Bacteroidia bacterium]